MDNYYQKLEYDYEASASSKPINLKLIFSDDEVNSPVITKQKISGKNGGNESIKVILVDADTQQEVTTGPVASAKVKIVLVQGNYDGATTMEAGEFERNIVVNWGKKKILLQGDVDLNLKHGTGTVGEIRIKHDRNPIKNVEFRLGAMVVDCPYEVKQAITQPFKVKDRRNAPKCSRSLLLPDKVGQLKNIRKNGVIHKRLESLNVCTVKDFLNMYNSNRQTLQQIYGVSGNKKWETTVNHAKTCNVPYENHAKTCNVPYENDSYGKEMIVDDNFSINDYYTPQPYENESYSEKMIVNDNFLIHDHVEEYCDMDFMWFHDQGSTLLPCQEASREDGIICGESSMEGNGVKARKRWMKMRTLLFSIASFMCICDLASRC